MKINERPLAHPYVVVLAIAEAATMLCACGTNSDGSAASESDAGSSEATSTPTSGSRSSADARSLGSSGSAEDSSGQSGKTEAASSGSNASGESAGSTSSADATAGSIAPSDAGATHWVGTWTASPYPVPAGNMPPASLSNSVLRQVVRVSLGGSQIRAQFSNVSGNGPITIKSAHVAICDATPAVDSTIDIATDKALAFSGVASVTIAQGQEL